MSVMSVYRNSATEGWIEREMEREINRKEKGDSYIQTNSVKVHLFKLDILVLLGYVSTTFQEQPICHLPVNQSNHMLHNTCIKKYKRRLELFTSTFFIILLCKVTISELSSCDILYFF